MIKAQMSNLLVTFFLQIHPKIVIPLTQISPYSTSYISKQEGPKTIIEGSGSVKVKEDQKSATFKYIRTLLTEGSEQGVEVRKCLIP